MGRLTLNVLLSFAQFEREVIGERVRDKIAASKRKGIWVGGPVPLGYRSVDKKLEIVPEEADLVRKIFADYLCVGSIGALAASLDQEGVRPKPRKLVNGKRIAAERFMVGPLAHLLKNRFYIGEVAYHGEIHPGAHEPILSKELFESVQTRLKEGVVRRSTLRSASPSILTGRLFDDRDNPMTPTHANKKSVRYRYYVSHALLQGRRSDAGSVARVSAPDVEKVIVDVARSQGPASDAVKEIPDRDLVHQYVTKATITRDHIALTVSDQVGSDDEAARTVKIAFIPTLTPHKGVAHAPSAYNAIDDQTRAALLTAIARSREWLDAIIAGRTATFEDIARDEKLVERHVRFLAPLAYLSPRIVEAIADSRAPADLTVSRLARHLPMSWSRQEQKLGFA